MQKKIFLYIYIHIYNKKRISCFELSSSRASDVVCYFWHLKFIYLTYEFEMSKTADDTSLKRAQSAVMKKMKKISYFGKNVQNIIKRRIKKQNYTLNTWLGRDTFIINMKMWSKKKIFSQVSIQYLQQKLLISLSFHIIYVMDFFVS